jgi:hypothetical protein
MYLFEHISCGHITLESLMLLYIMQQIELSNVICKFIKLVLLVINVKLKSKNYSGCV